MDEFEQRVSELEVAARAQADHALKLIKLTIQAWEGDAKLADRVRQLMTWQNELKAWKKKHSETHDVYERYARILEFIKLCNRLGGIEWETK
ncbi:MAG: hypothetical protein QXG98_04740 [Candidatus Micrarchaeia archaeon]